MPLNEAQTEGLSNATRNYNYPFVTYDFGHNIRMQHPNKYSFENSIRQQLTSGDEDVVRDGLSNVLYWGYERDNRRDYKVCEFRKNIWSSQDLDNLNAVSPSLEEISSVALSRKIDREIPLLGHAMALFNDIDALHPNMINHRHLKKLPEYGLAFITKTFMFLDPERFVALDSKIHKLREYPQTIFANLDNHLNLTQNNVDVYQQWCELCVRIANEYPDLNARAVDVERGIYQMVQDGQTQDAAVILVAA